MAKFRISDGSFLSIDGQRIQEAYDIVTRAGPQAVAMSRDHLFSVYPEAMPLFANIDLEQHNIKWVLTLSFVVDNLENEAELREYLFELGRRHVKYGTEEWYYEWVGVSLLKGFARACGEAWTQEFANEWCKLYVVMKSMMMDGHNSLLPEKDRTKVWSAESLKALGYSGELSPL